MSAEKQEQDFIVLIFGDQNHEYFYIVTNESEMENSTMPTRQLRITGAEAQVIRALCPSSKVFTSGIVSLLMQAYGVGVLTGVEKTMRGAGGGRTN